MSRVGSEAVTISVITATYRREDLLQRCVESVLAQDVDATFEQIVVNDAGECLRPAPWMRHPRVTTITTQHTERCVARNTGAALSHGEWLYFLDDDDYLLPGALAALLEVARGGAYSVIFGSYRVVSVSEGTSRVIRPLLPADALPMFLAGEGLPLQASAYRRDAFFGVGGFDPLMVSGQDSDLVRKVARSGDFGGTRAVLSVIRTDHPATSLTDWSGHVKRWHLGIERCLDVHGTASRIARKTAALPYWRGRCAREYTASAWRNVAAGRFATAALRLAVGCRLLSRRPIAVQLWRGFARRPVPDHNGLDQRLIQVTE
jgi:glycosyltransferase involved in cell wall biosynthesis